MQLSTTLTTLRDRLWSGLYTVYLAARYRGETFHFYGLNPRSLSENQKKATPILLLHAAQSSQSCWIPLAKKLHEASISPVYTFNYEEENRFERLKETIAHIRNIYQSSGVAGPIPIILIGHSLGAITATQYTYSIEDKVPDTTIHLLISISGRLKVIPNSPFYSAFRSLISSINRTHKHFLSHPKRDLLHIIGGEKDWLVPQESIFIHDNPKKQLRIAHASHIDIIYARETHDQIIEWLS